MKKIRFHPRPRQREKLMDMPLLPLKQQTAVTRLAMALGESTDLNALYRIIFIHVSEVIDASSFLISEFNEQEAVIHPKYAVRDGLEVNVTKLPPIPLDEGSQGIQSKVILTGKPLFTNDFQDELQGLQFLEAKLNIAVGAPPSHPQDFRETLCSALVAPLRVSGKSRGVIQVQSEKVDAFSESDMDLLSAMANVAAAAIQNASLYETMQHMNVDLSLSYDSTLEGWARALELRDFETTGHSVRVTDLALILAVYMGIRGEGLVNVRRGALLHDVGKMGISDDILLKPGPLTPDEWDTMRKHPLFGFRMLEPIEFLRPSLDIVLYHHEKWDGTGYPASLSGESIPLSARVFAIVDVWDSLIHSRPYKKAWSEEAAREHIQGQSGTHFDPEVVEKFFSIVS